MSERILCVSYDASLCQTREWILQRAGYSVSSALTLHTAVRLCKVHRFDLVVIDGAIPAKENRWITKALRSMCAAPILALVHGDDHAIEADYKLEAQASPSLFASTVKKILSEAEVA